MIMIPSKTGLRQGGPESPVAPEWMAIVREDGAETPNTRIGSGKSKAWWDRVANIIAGRR